MERIFTQDDKLIIHKQTDPTASLEAVKLAREAPTQPISDSWHVGRIDKHVLELWVKEAGVRFDDREAVKEIIRKKLLDGDNKAFRVKEGNF